MTVKNDFFIYELIIYNSNEWSTDCRDRRDRPQKEETRGGDHAAREVTAPPGKKNSQGGHFYQAQQIEVKCELARVAHPQ